MDLERLFGERELKGPPFPLATLLGLSQDIVDLLKDEVVIHYAARCPSCLSTVTFDEPFTIYEELECASCGAVTPFVAGWLIVRFLSGQVHPAKDDPRMRRLAEALTRFLTRPWD